MPTTLALNKFNLGTISEKVAGSTALQGSLKQCENAIVELTGSVRKRAGFKYVTTLPGSGLLFPFIYNNEEYFSIFVYDGGIKIYNDVGEVWGKSDINWVDILTVSIYQIQDVVYIVSPNFAPMKLIRLSKDGTNWSLNTVQFNEPPYLPENDTDFTFSCNIAATDGTTAVGTAGVITSSMDASTLSSQFSAGMWLRLNTVSGTDNKWSWWEITSISGQTLNVSYKGGTCYKSYASKIWRASAFKAGSYPTCCCIHESRMCYCMGRNVFLSKSDSYENFALTNADGTVAATNAMTVTINMKQASDIVWCASDRNLLIGTNNEEYAVKADDYGSTLTPTTIKAQQQSSVGSVNYPVVSTDSGVIAIKKFGKKAIYYAYSSEAYRYGYKDLNLYNEDITSIGINDIAYTSDPTPILWMSLVDGTLVGCTLSIQDDVIAFHHHSTQGEILSITALPNRDTSDMNLWLAVRRKGNNGVSKVFLEVMDNGVNVNTKDTLDVHYSDCWQVLESRQKTTDWILDSTSLESHDVKILADGATQPDTHVVPYSPTQSKMTIQYPANKVVVGLGYDMYIQPTEMSVQEVVLQNKAKNVVSVSASLYKTVGCWIGSENDKLMEIPWRNTNDRMNQALPPYTNLKKLLMTGGWRTDGAIVFGHKDPLPFWLLAIYFDTNFGG